MKIEKSSVKRILVITLSNTGDIILTTPVMRTLAKEFPGARIDVMAGPYGREIFEKDPRIFKFIVYDKRLPIIQKRRLQLKLKKLKYDLVVDLRNTVFPLLIGTRYRTGTIERFPKTVFHRRDRHLYRLKSLGITDVVRQSCIFVPDEDEAYVSDILRDETIKPPIAAISPGAKSHLKRWTAEGFAEVADRLIAECSASVVFVGAQDDEEVVGNVMKRMKQSAHNLVGRTNIRQLAALFKRARVVITNDSAPLHLGCAVGTRVLALFGPTDPKKYGPTGEFDIAINKQLSCSPCESAVCSHNYECMKLISSDEVFEAAKMMVEGYG